MATRTRDERQRRIATDDGDPDDTVYVGGSASQAYHEADPEDGCHSYPSSPQPVPRQQAQRMGCYPCRDCVLGEYEPCGGSKSVATIMRREDVTSMQEAAAIARDEQVGPFATEGES